MPGPRQPIEVIEARGRKHLGKAEIEERKKREPNRFQLADDSFYLTFTLNLGSVAINSNPSGGAIVGVYGIK